MAEVTVNLAPPQPVIESVTLTLSQDEAEELWILLGSCSGSYSVYNALDDALTPTLDYSKIDKKFSVSTNSYSVTRK